MNEPVGKLDTVTTGLYEHLVHLTALCGLGLPADELFGRFLRSMQPEIPADGLWIHCAGSLLVGAGCRCPRVPAVPDGSDLRARSEADGMVVATLAPGVTLSCIPCAGYAHRGEDGLGLVARLLALIWRAEEVTREYALPMDYQQAKASFENRWLLQLLRRHDHNISQCAKASGLSRVTIYNMMKRHGIAGSDSGEESVK